MTTANGSSKPYKKLYMPYMGEHTHTFQAAFQAHDIPVEQLPPSDQETLAIGLNLCKGRECLPCFTTTGDLVRRSREPDFDPEQSLFFMPTVTSACRFGQYTVLQKDIFKQIGLEGVEMLSPNANNSYQGMGERPLQLRLLIWQSGVAMDLLLKLLHEYRPYERTPGQTDAAYLEGRQLLVEATRMGKIEPIIQAMKEIAERFEALPVERSERRPLIALVGEIYIRMTPSINHDLIRLVETMGGEVALASMIEWVYYTNWKYRNVSGMFGKVGEQVKITLIDWYQQYLERKVARPVRHLLSDPHEPPIARLMDNIRPYYHPELGSECVLSMGRAIECARHGASGIINVLPFACMPGTIAASLAPRIRADLNHVPWLDIAYDAQGVTNITTRLEAFMYQASQFRQRTGMQYAHA